MRVDSDNGACSRQFLDAARNKICFAVIRNVEEMDKIGCTPY